MLIKQISKNCIIIKFDEAIVAAYIVIQSNKLIISFKILKTCNYKTYYVCITSLEILSYS